MAMMERPASDECWDDWPFTRSHGYAKVARQMMTHVVLELSGRPRPQAPGNHALHSCDNPPCLNQAHLRWGTSKENTNDKVTRGRCPSLQGELHPNAKLTEADVREIRRRYAAGGVSYAELASEYGMSKSPIAFVVTRRRWAHVEDEAS